MENLPIVLGTFDVKKLLDFYVSFNYYISVLEVQRVNQRNESSQIVSPIHGKLGDATDDYGFEMFS